MAASRAAVSDGGSWSSASTGLCRVTTSSASPMRRLPTSQPCRLMRVPGVAVAGSLTSTRCTATRASCTGPVVGGAGGDVEVVCTCGSQLSASTAAVRPSSLSISASGPPAMAPGAASTSVCSGATLPSAARRWICSLDVVSVRGSRL